MPNISLPSIQSLLIKMEFNETQLSTGTGFVVISPNGTPHLITNRHNVTGRDQNTGKPLSSTLGIPNYITIIHNSSIGIGQWVEKREPLYIDDNPRWIEHPELGAKADFVALPLKNLSGVDLYPHHPQNPGPEIAIGPAERLSVVGFPFGISAGGGYAVWATGFMASEPDVNHDNLPIILIDCRSRQGQSGSPVLAYRSGGPVIMTDGSALGFPGPVIRFIGIYSGRINSESDIGIVWKAGALAELVNIL